jgi:hypothetical protein
MDIISIVIIVALSGAVLLLLYLQFRKPQSSAFSASADLSVTLQNLTQAVQSNQTQTAVMAETLSFGTSGTGCQWSSNRT